jgi:Raf kinase inhibitor-like YbhB/YbcL family protein
MKPAYKKLHFRECILILSLAALVTLSCEKRADQSSPTGEFRLFSPEVGTDSLLPQAYTCDGESATLPLAWTGVPAGTRAFALSMYHVASPEDIHWYWILYNIPASVGLLPKNVSGIGTLGNNSVNDNIGYAPPCSQGPGPKEYVFTLYALSDTMVTTISQNEVSRQVLLNSIGGITIDSASLTVIYSRDVK